MQRCTSLGTLSRRSRRVLAGAAQRMPPAVMASIGEALRWAELPNPLRDPCPAGAGHTNDARVALGKVLRFLSATAREARNIALPVLLEDDGLFY